MTFVTAGHGAKKVRNRMSLKPENVAKQYLLFLLLFFTSPLSCSRLHMVITRRVKQGITICTKL